MFAGSLMLKYQDNEAYVIATADLQPTEKENAGSFCSSTNFSPPNGNMSCRAGICHLVDAILYNSNVYLLSQWLVFFFFFLKQMKPLLFRSNPSPLGAIWFINRA